VIQLGRVSESGHSITTFIGLNFKPPVSFSEAFDLAGALRVR
jgi:hypothetical protein